MPRDSRQDATRSAPPGGKAAARTRQFLQARGLAADDPVAQGSPVEGRAQGWAGALRAEVASDPDSPVWRSLGPTVIRNGQTYGYSRVDNAGRVAAVAVDPGDGSHILVGAAGGGVWESRDRGGTWTPRGDDLATLTVGALCFDPHRPSTVYLGTGEGNSLPYAWLGQGVYRSTDGGTTWTLLVSEPFVGTGFYGLVADPTDPDRLYAATTSGLYISGDAGTNWQQVHESVCWSVSVDPRGGSTEVLAACGDGLLRSTDAGLAWTRLPVTDDATADRLTRMAVTHGGGPFGIAWVWAAVPMPSNPPSETAWLWLRIDGDEFEQIPVPGDFATVRNSWWNWYAQTAPNFDTVVYLGTTDLLRADWRKGDVIWTNLSTRPFPGESIHPDQHAIAFDPVDGDVVYAANDGGLFRSPNRGTNWSALNEGLVITEIEYLAQDVGSPHWLLAGTQDNGTIRYDGRREWDAVAGGDGGDCASSSTDPDTVYHSFYHMGLERSSDRGDNWTSATTGSTETSRYYQLFYPPLEANGTLVAQAGETVFVSRDSGASFTEVTLPGFPTSASALSIPDPDHVYVGTSFGRLLRTSWTGSGWSAAAELATVPGLGYVSDLAACPPDGRRMWLTSTFVGGPHVLRSDDAGTTWTDVSAGLPPLPVNAVAVHPDDPDRVWVALDKGVHQTRDGGATWSGMAVGLPNCLVVDLLYHRQTGLLRAGTRSRGVWECVVDKPAGSTSGVGWWGSLDAGATRTWAMSGWPASWHVQWTVQPASLGARLSSEVEVERVSAEHVTYHVTVRNLSASPARCEGRYAVLSP